MGEEEGPGLHTHICLLVSECEWGTRGGRRGQWGWERAAPEEGGGLGGWLRAQLVPHGDLPAWVLQHLLPVAALGARGVQAQAAAPKRAALPLGALAQHVQLHTGGPQQVIRQLKHDHLVPHGVDLVLGAFRLLLLQLPSLVLQGHLDRDIWGETGGQRQREGPRVSFWGVVGPGTIFPLGDGETGSLAQDLH